jgi:hypothetical protein
MQEKAQGKTQKHTPSRRYHPPNTEMLTFFAHAKRLEERITHPEKSKLKSHNQGWQLHAQVLYFSMPAI